MLQIDKPMTGEYAPYAITYINRLPDDGAVLQHLSNNGMMVQDLITSLCAEQLSYRYAPGKWNIKEMLVHMIDTERVFAYRAMCIARNDKTSFPSFEENDYAAASGADDREIDSILQEYHAVRAASLALLHSFTDADYLKIGTANNNPVSVRALAYQIAGHELHHVAIMRERYLTNV